MESLGTYLRSERARRGMDIAEVAERTKVPIASLELIEADRFDELPGEVFVRGFVRAYARHLDLDAELALERLDRPAPSPTVPVLPSSKLNLRRGRVASPALLFVLLLACLLLTVVVWRPVGHSLSANGPAPTSDSAG